MSAAVIGRGGESGGGRAVCDRRDMSWQSCLQIARFSSKATLCSQISPPPPPSLSPSDLTKLQSLTHRIKRPKSQRWHLAKATEDGAESSEIWCMTGPEGRRPGRGRRTELTPGSQGRWPSIDATPWVFFFHVNVRLFILRSRLKGGSWWQTAVQVHLDLQTCKIMQKLHPCHSSALCVCVGVCLCMCDFK